MNKKVKSNQKINKVKPKTSSKCFKIFSLCSKIVNFYSSSSEKKSVAPVFGEESSSDSVEEIPAEVRMRIVGHKTITSAGLNSFGKTKHGFERSSLSGRCKRPRTRHQGTRSDYIMTVPFSPVFAQTCSILDLNLLVRVAQCNMRCYIYLFKSNEIFTH